MNINENDKEYGLKFHKLQPSKDFEISLYNGRIKVFDEPLTSKDIIYSEEDPYGEEDWLDD